MVLGINRLDGTFVGAPRGTTTIESGDSIILYGKIDMCERLDERRRGNQGEFEHRQAVADQRRELAQDHQKCCRLANACGAYLVTQPGCANFSPTWNQIDVFIQEKGGY